MANNAEKPNIFKRIGQFFARLGKSIAKAFKNMFFELKKVTWPTKNEVINYCVVVFVFMIAMGVLIGLFDLGAGALVDLIVSF